MKNSYFKNSIINIALVCLAGIAANYLFHLLGRPAAIDIGDAFVGAALAFWLNNKDNNETI